MPTAGSSTERPTDRSSGRSSGRSTSWLTGWSTGWRDAVADVGHLVAFRAGTLRRRGPVRVVVAVLLAVTVAVAVLPALAAGAGHSDAAAELRQLLPAVLLGYLLLAVASAAASGGGRELLAREPASVHPISPTTDHLGALLLVPVNIAWIIQTWTLLGVTAYVVGPARVGAAQVLVVLWVAASTALAQLTAWCLEVVRRVGHGVAAIRVLAVALFAGVLAVHLADRLVPALDHLPTRALVRVVTGGAAGSWAGWAAMLAVAFVVLVLLGSVPATAAARRMPRDELRVEAGRYVARPPARTLLGSLVRVDRASVWRAVPMRRGLLVLALGPGLVAVLGDLPWTSVTILPGLVASGGALLYGVNAWCLDGRGALWRESLPVPPQVVFDARALVLAEFLLVASVLTLAVAAVRAGVPTSSELASALCALAVVIVQVVAAALRWSVAQPIAVDLRSARATPAPPSVMVGYSARLAVATTFTGLAFSVVAVSGAWFVAPALAAVMSIWSGRRLLRTRRAWADPVERARVVTTVALA